MNMKGNRNITLCFIGPPGSGKGTQTRMLAKAMGFKVIEVGDCLRDLSKTRSALGRKIKSYVEKGKIVPVDIIENVLTKEVKKIKRGQPLIFDGFPRTKKQVKVLEKILKANKRSFDDFYLVYISLPLKEAVSRLRKRRMCEKCESIFINGVTIPKGSKICPLCHGKIIRRSDDKPEVIRKRFQVYKKQTEPVLDYYKGTDKIIKINGNQPPEAVFKEIKKNLKQKIG